MSVWFAEASWEFFAGAGAGFDWLLGGYSGSGAGAAVGATDRFGGEADFDTLAFLKALGRSLPLEPFSMIPSMLRAAQIKISFWTR